jgi:hypothetical protein
MIDYHFRSKKKKKSVEGMSLISRDVAFGLPDVKIAHAICSK